MNIFAELRSARRQLLHAREDNTEALRELASSLDEYTVALNLAVEALEKQPYAVPTSIQTSRGIKMNIPAETLYTRSYGIPSTIKVPLPTGAIREGDCVACGEQIESD